MNIHSLFGIRQLLFPFFFLDYSHFGGFLIMIPYFILSFFVQSALETDNIRWFWSILGYHYIIAYVWSSTVYIYQIDIY